LASDLPLAGVCPSSGPRTAGIFEGTQPVLGPRQVEVVQEQKNGLRDSKHAGNNDQRPIRWRRTSVEALWAVREHRTSTCDRSTNVVEPPWERVSLCLVVAVNAGTAVDA
jgi:hypothetical protein